MAANSFQRKGWRVTRLSALLALGAVASCLMTCFSRALFLFQGALLLGITAASALLFRRTPPFPCHPPQTRTAGFRAGRKRQDDLFLSGFRQARQVVRRAARRACAEGAARASCRRKNGWQACGGKSWVLPYSRLWRFWGW
jgi:hypothetical protein